MEYHFTPPLLLVYSSVILVPIILILLFLKPNKRSLTKLPPSPTAWPVFGHLFNLGTLPYATMAKMKHKYGPVIWLKLGSINTMVVLSADAAAELYKNHDLAFADRWTFETLTSHDYHKSSMAFSPHGPYWRMLRRVFISGINSKIDDDSLQVRRKCVNDMLSWIGKEAETAKIGTRVIKIIDFIFLTNVNVIANLLFSKDLVDPDSRVGAELFTAVTGFFRWSGKPNVSDLFGWLKPFDLQGLKRNMERDLGKGLAIVSELVKGRIQEKQQKKGGEKRRRKDLLDVLLEFEVNGVDEQKMLSEHNISILLLEMFLGGGETTSNIIEWAMTELLRYPEILNHAKHEILKLVGRERRFTESDIDNLPFLRAIIKETLRLHPPGPLIGRKSCKDTCFMGYDIPKGTHVMINIWAIGRDQECWSDPLNFKPERFIGSNVDYRGQCFDFLPFGAGRRICAGLPLAHRLLHLLLGSLIHEFDWELEDSVPLDMTEKLGISLRKLEPLRVIPSFPRI